MIHEKYKFSTARARPFVGGSLAALRLFLLYSTLLFLVHVTTPRARAEDGDSSPAGHLPLVRGAHRVAGRLAGRRAVAAAVVAAGLRLVVLAQLPRVVVLAARGGGHVRARDGVLRAAPIPGDGGQVVHRVRRAHLRVPARTARERES